MRASTDPHAATADRYRAFAEIEARGMSTCYEEWASGVADGPATLALTDRLPSWKRQPNLVCSASRLCGAAVARGPTASSDFVLALDGEPIAFTQPRGRAPHWLG